MACENSPLGLASSSVPFPSYFEQDQRSNTFLQTDCCLPSFMRSHFDDELKESTHFFERGCPSFSSSNPIFPLPMFQISPNHQTPPDIQNIHNSSIDDSSTMDALDKPIHSTYSHSTNSFEKPTNSFQKPTEASVESTMQIGHWVFTVRCEPQTVNQNQSIEEKNAQIAKLLEYVSVANQSTFAGMSASAQNEKKAIRKKLVNHPKRQSESKPCHVPPYHISESEEMQAIRAKIQEAKIRDPESFTLTYRFHPLAKKFLKAWYTYFLHNYLKTYVKNCVCVGSLIWEKILIPRPMICSGLPTCWEPKNAKFKTGCEITGLNLLFLFVICL